MYIVVDERQSVAAQYVEGFGSEGVAARGLDVRDVRTWIDATPVQDLEAVQGFVIGDCADRTAFTELLRGLSRAPIIALNETRSLEQTLALFTAGIDDVVRKPVHVREIIARAGAIRRRTNRSEATKPASTPDRSGRLTVHTDGRDPEIDGQSLLLPRRERDILDYLARNRGRPVTKGQIFKAVYGDLDTAVDESVVEGHISKLRKKLRMRLGYDPIEAKRLAGYTFVG
ncbi:response regulator transcription factor [Methylobacterium platani]|uniref:Transcriptional regulator n=2 Tax=Methylobacterium platani TaxID=427683 RepID=A0A179SIX8_9HYPH|nr:response regulator transcription factor [Methylobacterium platani]KMO16503.1 transcriptional regulator [Methylobacterium platani JCM 14648]OAS27439.1 transcriptional regulator [Methylobacterium platani]